MRIPAGERRPDLYRPQVTIPTVHPNGYYGPGLRIKDSTLQEGGYDPQRAFPPTPYSPYRSPQGPAPFGPSGYSIPGAPPGYNLEGPPIDPTGAAGMGRAIYPQPGGPAFVPPPPGIPGTMTGGPRTGSALDRSYQPGGPGTTTITPTTPPGGYQGPMPGGSRGGPASTPGLPSYVSQQPAVTLPGGPQPQAPAVPLLPGMPTLPPVTYPTSLPQTSGTGPR